MLALYRRALHARRAEPGLGDGPMTWLAAPAGVLAFDRGGGFACVVNLSPTPVELPRVSGTRSCWPAARCPAGCCRRTRRPGCGPSGGEDLAQGGGEGVRLAGLTVFAAEEATVVAREGDRRDPEPLGHGRARPARQLLGRTRRRRRSRSRVGAVRSASKSCR